MTYPCHPPGQSRRTSSGGFGISANRVRSCCYQKVCQNDGGTAGGFRCNSPFDSEEPDHLFCPLGYGSDVLLASLLYNACISGLERADLGIRKAVPGSSRSGDAANVVNMHCRYLPVTIQSTAENWKLSGEMSNGKLS